MSSSTSTGSTSGNDSSTASSFPDAVRRIAAICDEATTGVYDSPWPDPGDDQNLGELVRSARTLVENLAETKRREGEMHSHRQEVADDFERVVTGVVESVAAASAELKATAENLSENACETSKQATTLEVSVGETTRGIEHFASMIGEFTTAIHDIDTQVSTSTQYSMAAVQAAEEAGELVQGLAEASHRISSVLGMIQEVADQTNLLALNATIEAARAGEAGKGFAVVASEVKNLSSQTGEATTEIDDQVRGIQDATTSVVTAIDLISETIAELSTVSQLIAEALNKQGAVTQEMNQGATDTSELAQSMSKNVGHVAETATLTSSSCENLLDAATELSTMAETLHGEVQRVVEDMRSD